MNERFAAIPMHPVPAGTPILRSDVEGVRRVTLDDPASTAMTDLRQVPARTVMPRVLADDALANMIHAGVRLLLVVDEEDAIQGVVTARDILGEKPVQAAQAEGIPRHAVQVAHVMTPREQLEALALSAVEQARVGDVLQTLKRSGRQHTLVVAHGSQGETVCGLFSATQVGRQLGVEIPPEGPAQSFAEIEQLLQP